MKQIYKNLKEHLAPSRFKMVDVGRWKCGECGTSVQGRKRAKNLVNCNVIKKAKAFVILPKNGTK